MNATNRLKNLLKVWMVLFTGATAVFLFHGNTMIRLFNFLSGKMNLPFPLLPLPAESFWLTLTMSLMITLVVLCFMAQRDMEKNLEFVIPILVSKFTSTFFFFMFFLFETRALAYLMGLFCDGTIFIITYCFYREARKEIHGR